MLITFKTTYWVKVDHFEMYLECFENREGPCTGIGELNKATRANSQHFSKHDDREEIGQSTSLPVCVPPEVNLPEEWLRDRIKRATLPACTIIHRRSSLSLSSSPFEG
jgi:hypothetical protein